MRKEVLTLPEIQRDRACLAIANRYKHLNTIRRDLRDADRILEQCIQISQRLSANPGVLSQASDEIFYAQAALMHAVTLYGRWFKSTEGKPTLKEREFFAKGSKEHSVHSQLIELRDQYIAHRELDILGSDSIWACFTDDGKFVRTHSTWLEQRLPNTEELRSIQNAIRTVHNKIDRTMLPEVQSKLEEALKKIYG